MKYWDSSASNYHDGMIPNAPSKFRGTWWPAGREDLKRSGRLVVRRKLVPHLVVDTWESPPYLFSKYNHPAIFGVSHQGIPITLFDCWNTGTEFFNEHAGRSGYVPEAILWGGHAGSKDEGFCSRIHVECPAALEVGRSHPKLIYATSADGLDSVTAPKESDVFPAASFGNSMHIQAKIHWLSSGSHNGEWRITPRVFIEISSDTMLSVLECQKTISRLKIALRFATCLPIDFPLIELWSKSNILPCGIFHLGRIRKKNDRRFYYYSLQENSVNLIGSAITAILQIDQKALSAIAHFQDAVDGIGEDVESRFFDIARTLERLLGLRVGGDTIIDISEHRTHVENMMASISRASSEYRERLGHLLDNANCHSPRSKIKRFINEDEQAASLVPDGPLRSKFISRVVAARNAIAHFTKSDEDPVSWQDLEILIRLTDLCIWRIIGISRIPLRERYGQWSLKESASDDK
jgi:hypothetical protein